MKVPKGWKYLRMDEAGQVEGGRQRSPHITAGKLRPYLRVANVHEGRIDISDVFEMLFTESEFVRFKLFEGDILLNEGQSLELCGRPAIYKGKPADCCYQNTLIRFRPRSETDSQYAFSLFLFFLDTGVFASISSQTTSIAHLGVSRFAGLRGPFPPLAEQRRIAEILRSWERAIEAQQKLLTAKTTRLRTLRHQLLTGAKRFPEFKQKWQKVQFTYLFERVDRKASAATEHVLSITAGRGFVDQREKFSKVIAGRNIANYVLLKRGEFAYNKGNSGRYPQGCVYRLSEFEEGAVPNVWISFRSAKSEMDPEFYKHFFLAGGLNQQLAGMINSGVRNDGLLNVRPDAFFAVSVPYPPTKAEQTRIATLLNACQREIDLLTAQLEALKEQKRSIMQKLLTGEVRVKV